MNVWCGQCQARNDGNADFCGRCGAPLNALAGRARVRPASDPTTAAAPAAHRALRLYDPTPLERLIEEQAPDRPDLQAMIRKCRVAIRGEDIEGRLGRRLYFLPDRPGSYFEAPEETYTLAGSGESVTLVIVKDAERPSRKAVHYVETRPAIVATPLEAQLAQYDQLAREKRTLQWQAWLAGAGAALLVVFLLTSGVFAGSFTGPGLALLVGSTALAVYGALYAYGLAIRLADRHKAVAALEAVLGLAPLSDGRTHALRARGVPALASSLAAVNMLLGVWIALALALLWLTGRALLTNGAVPPPWEPPVVIASTALLYPVIALGRAVRRRVLVRRLQAQLARAVAEGRACSFEPWLD